MRPTTLHGLFEAARQRRQSSRATPRSVQSVQTGVSVQNQQDGSKPVRVLRALDAIAQNSKSTLLVATWWRGIMRDYIQYPLASAMPEGARAVAIRKRGDAIQNAMITYFAKPNAIYDAITRLFLDRKLYTPDTGTAHRLVLTPQGRRVNGILRRVAEAVGRDPAQPGVLLAESVPVPRGGWNFMAAGRRAAERAAAARRAQRDALLQRARTALRKAVTATVARLDESMRPNAAATTGFLANANAMVNAVANGNTARYTRTASRIKYGGDAQFLKAFPATFEAMRQRHGAEAKADQAFLDTMASIETDLRARDVPRSMIQEPSGLSTQMRVSDLVREVREVTAPVLKAAANRIENQLDNSISNTENRPSSSGSAVAGVVSQLQTTARSAARSTARSTARSPSPRPAAVSGSTKKAPPPPPPPMPGKAPPPPPPPMPGRSTAGSNTGSNRGSNTRSNVGSNTGSNARSNVGSNRGSTTPLPTPGEIETASLANLQRMRTQVNRELQRTRSASRRARLRRLLAQIAFASSFTGVMVRRPNAPRGPNTSGYLAAAASRTPSNVPRLNTRTASRVLALPEASGATQAGRARRAGQNRPSSGTTLLLGPGSASVTGPVVGSGQRTVTVDTGDLRVPQIGGSRPGLVAGTGMLGLLGWTAAATYLRGRRQGARRTESTGSRSTRASNARVGSYRPRSRPFRISVASNTESNTENTASSAR